MKFVRINEAEHFKLMCTIFEEVIEEHHNEECKMALTMFSNRVHAKLFSKGRLETTENVRKVMKEVFQVG